MDFTCTPWQYCRIKCMALARLHPWLLRKYADPRQASARCGEAPFIYDTWYAVELYTIISSSDSVMRHTLYDLLTADMMGKLLWPRDSRLQNTDLTPLPLEYAAPIYAGKGRLP